MKTVYKYALEPEMKLPKGAKILSVNIQQDVLCLWSEVDTELPLEQRNFLAYGTGWQINPDSKREFIATVFGPSGLVWHIYEVLP